jgi:hypothetical protein
MNNERGIITLSHGVACAQVLAGFPIERAFLGKDGRVQVCFPVEGTAVYEVSLRVSRGTRHHGASQEAGSPPRNHR